MAKKQANKFKAAVKATSDIKNCYREGLDALGKYSSKIRLPKGSACEGSVDIDECTKKKYPKENRWDYTFGYKSQAYFVEVHSANTSDVSIVIKKLNWLKAWLISEAPELNKIKAPEPYYWVQSGKYAIMKNTPQARLVAAAGIKPLSILKLQ